MRSNTGADMNQKMLKDNSKHHITRMRDRFMTAP
jgi:hypothetical protein